MQPHFCKRVPEAAVDDVRVGLERFPCYCNRNNALSPFVVNLSNHERKICATCPVLPFDRLRVNGRCFSGYSIQENALSFIKKPGAAHDRSGLCCAAVADSAVIRSGVRPENCRQF
jgi:hypothetical protein